MTPDRLGRVTQLSPLRVLLNGDLNATPARAMSDFTGATASATNGTEVLVRTVEGQRYAWRVLS